MNLPSENRTTRREFIKSTGRFAAASALAGTVLPHVHGAEDNTIRLALIGCGGRGTGAVGDALRASGGGPVKLVAMADVLERRLNTSFNGLKTQFGERVEVPEDRRFVSFDGYKQAMEVLRPGDVAIFATPPAFRWVHFSHAIEKGLNVFMEKPLTVDGPTSRRMLDLGARAEAKNLKVGVGLMIRHCRARQELHRRVQDGQVGDLMMMRAYRMHGPTGSAFSTRKPDGISELMYQVQRFHSFLWASGGLFSDFYIHQIDECCWMKDSWPVRAQAMGGRHYRGEYLDQNFDVYSVEYTFADGAKLFMDGRTMSGCHDEFSSYVHGTRGVGIVSTSSHYPGRCRIYRGQNVSRENLEWAFPQPEANPYQLEWEHLMAAIRDDTPYNEVRRGVEASLVTSMGRLAAHTGQVVTFEEMLNHEHEFAPGLENLTFDSEAPLASGADGRYPVPEPGIKRRREF